MENIYDVTVRRYRKKPVIIEAYRTYEDLDIETEDGVIHADAGDYIVTNMNDGKTHSCKPDIFEQTYEAIINE